MSDGLGGYRFNRELYDLVLGVLEVLWDTPIAPIRGRWEFTDELRAVLEPLLCFRRRPDPRGRPPQDMRAK